MSDMLKNEIKEKLKEIAEDVVDVAIEFTPMKEENDKINSTIIWQKFFHDIFIEILNFEHGFIKAKTSYTEALLEFGSKENPQALYQYVDMLSTRLEKIHIVKRMCNALGLQGEMDHIIEQEMNLLYKTPTMIQHRTVDTTNKIAGEGKV